MNYFSTQRVTTLTIMILILLNLSTLAMLWSFRFKQPVTPLPVEGTGHVEHFLQQELGLTDRQAQQFDKLRKQHFEQSKIIVDASQQLKRALIEHVFAASPDTEKMQAIAEEIGAKQIELETLRYTHFLELKALCEPGQLERFQALFHEIFPPQPGGQLQPGGQPQPQGMLPGQGPQPPQEAITACLGKNQGDSCQFTGPRGMVTGTCQNIGNQLACVPEGSPPGGPPPGQNNRP